MGPVQGLDTAAYSLPRMKEWLLILPILSRLYTSVIPWNPEINGLEVSWSTDMSPTTIFLESGHPRIYIRTSTGGAGVYPGWWRTVGAWEGYTGYYPPAILGPIFSIFKAKGPTYGPKKAILEVSMRFPQI